MFVLRAMKLAGEKKKKALASIGSSRLKRHAEKLIEREEEEDEEAKKEQEGSVISRTVKLRVYPIRCIREKQ